jgi:hypothetical protein
VDHAHNDRKQSQVYTKKKNPKPVTGNLFTKKEGNDGETIDWICKVKKEEYTRCTIIGST